jgi:hypothetical protein
MALVANAALAQGRGMGQGRGAGGGMGMRRGAGAGWCNGQGPGAGLRNGQGLGAGAGGWWTRVTPKTAEQKAFVDRVTKLHADIRTTNLEIATLRSKNAPQDQVAQKQSEVAGLRAELSKVTQSNTALLKELGVPVGYGVCDGTGPKANCPMAGSGQGRGPGCGMGRGNGMGLRNGTGPNPNCPLKK